MELQLIRGDRGSLMFCYGGEEEMIKGGRGSPLNFLSALTVERRQTSLSSLYC